jgi:CTP synthase
VEVAIVGKYVELPDAYKSVVEALHAAGFAHRAKVNVRWVVSDECGSAESTAKSLAGVDAVVIPGGFGDRGVPGKIQALTWSRTRLVPTLGLCLGMQCMAIEGLREVAGLVGADSEEFDREAEHLVISTMADQTDIVAGRGDMGGTMRLGTYPAELAEGSIAAEVYGATEVNERHRHRYEVNNAYRDQLQKSGFVISGLSPDGRLVEFIELDRDVHPYYVATQAHPELKSRPTRPHPLFAGLVDAALKRQAAERLDIEAA